MRPPRYSLRLVSAALVLGATAYLGFEGDSLPLPEPLTQAERRIDSYLVNARIRQFGADGLPERTLEARRVDHLAAEEIYLISTPHLLVHAGNRTLSLTAEQGQADPNDQLLELDGSVEVIRDGAPPLRLTTAWLNVRLRENLAWTDAPVRLEKGPLVTEATGLDARLDQGLVELRQNVRGTYAIP